MVLGEEQTQISGMDREPRNRLTRYGQLIFEKMQKQFKKGRIIFATSGARAIFYSQGKNKNKNKNMY